MFKRSVTMLLAVALIAGLTTSCILDPKEERVVEKPKPVEYKDLKAKDDVLFNLELAYNERNMNEYDKLLDDAFIFIFSDADFSDGKTPRQWDRAGEVIATSKILDPQTNGDKRVVVIDLRLDYPADNWTEEPENQDHPGESWFSKTISYDLVVKTADDWEHRALDKKAQFTIRWAGDADTGHWRIVLWRDDVE